MHTMAKDKAPEYFTEWTDEMIERFLVKRTNAGELNDTDFDIAIYAYQFMLPEVFTRFLVLFKETGLDINAKNVEGQTVLQYISTHGRSEEYVKALAAAGAE